MPYPRELIRNFSIIAHIDHGKSTLADRMMQSTGTVTDREMRDQLLDSMDIERERGITIKARAVRMMYKAKDGKTYQLNMVDTPGHVDFSYEVSRSLAGCEGALLLVDAAQGVEAQTIANAYLALDGDLEIIPVVNKIDLPSADLESAYSQIEEAIGLDRDDALLASAKTGQGVEEILEAIVQRIPPPPLKHFEAERTRALIFDSEYESYRGTIVYFRVFEGELKRGDKIRFMKTGVDYEITEIGIFTPLEKQVDSLGAGEVGWFAASIKEITSVRVGDTVTLARKPAAENWPGYREVHPFVYAGMFPTASDDFEDLATAVEKISLNDASFVYEKETSEALGFGFRCGFLGMLHMEIIQERLEREFNLDLVITAPNVGYRIVNSRGEEIEIDNPADMPEPNFIEKMEEPIIEGRFLVPSEYVGAVITLAQGKKGTQKSMQYLSSGRVLLSYDFPLSEIIYDFYDKLKSVTKGYASFDYEISGWRQAKLSRLDILINGDPIDALSTIVHRADADRRGRALCKRLREEIDRQQYEVAIQAAIGGKVIARETVKAMRKDVTAKCYGGDITRKRKLLEKQKEGKKRMRQLGRVEIPQKAFMAVLKADD